LADGFDSVAGDKWKSPKVVGTSLLATGGDLEDLRFVQTVIPCRQFKQAGAIRTKDFILPHR